jgi:hypothetical protein
MGPLHQLTADELRLTNLVTQTAMADAKRPSDEVVGSSAPKVQDRVVSVPEISLISDVAGKDSRRAPGTKTAEAHAPTAARRLPRQSGNRAATLAFLTGRAADPKSGRVQLHNCWIPGSLVSRAPE